MLPAKDWATVSEDTLQRAAAGWVWLNTYIQGRGRSLPNNVRIGDAAMSKLAPPGAILRQNVEGGQSQIIASMGNRIWAVIGLPLEEVSTVDGVRYSFGRAQRALQWFHIFALKNWDIVPFVATRHEQHGVIMKPTGPPQPLVKHVLSTKNTSLLTDEDVRRI